MLKPTDSIPREEASRILADYGDFRSKCEEHGYVYPPVGWSPFPPSQVAAAMLSEARRYLKEYGEKHFDDVFRPRFLALSRLTIDPNHQFVNFCEKTAAARPAYSVFCRRVHGRARALERDLRVAWERNRRTLDPDPVFIPAGLTQRWDTMPTEQALEIIKVYNELGAQGHGLLTESRIRNALKQAAPETYTSVANRCMTESVSRSLAIIGDGAAEGSVTGVTRDWILSGAMMVGDLPTSAMLRRFRISDPQLLDRNLDAIREENYYRNYWGFGFDCYERSFHNLLDRKYEDDTVHILLNDLRKLIAAQPMDGDYNFLTYLQTCEREVASVWKNLKLSMDGCFGRTAIWALPTGFKVAHPKYVWRSRFSRGKISVPQLVSEYQNGDAWVLYFPYGYRGYDAPDTLRRGRALRLLGLKDDYRFHRDTDGWTMERPLAIGGLFGKVELAEVLAKYQRMKVEDLAKSAIRKEREAHRACASATAAAGHDTACYDEVPFSSALDACRLRCLEYVNDAFNGEECAWRGSDSESSEDSVAQVVREL